MEIKRTHVDADRYVFDFDHCTYAKGWAQIDTEQDASYYGTWCNATELKIVNYCEGDTTVWHCASTDEFVAEMRELERWNDEHGWGPARVDVGTHPDMWTQLEKMGLGDMLH